MGTRGGNTIVMIGYYISLEWLQAWSLGLVNMMIGFRCFNIVSVSLSTGTVGIYLSVYSVRKYVIWCDNATTKTDHSSSYTIQGFVEYRKEYELHRKWEFTNIWSLICYEWTFVSLLIRRKIFEFLSLCLQPQYVSCSLKT